MVCFNWHCFTSINIFENNKKRRSSHTRDERRDKTLSWCHPDSD